MSTNTLKSLLRGSALETIDPVTAYFFCDAPDCPVVYFNQQSQIFVTEQVKVAVFHKDRGLKVSVCYCFDWTRDRILQEIEQTGSCQAETAIRIQVKAKRCSCEVNNPQGHCCLTNVRSFIESQTSNFRH